MPPHHHVPHSSASDQGSHFIAKDVQWALLTGVTMFPTSLDNLGLTVEIYLLKTQLCVSAVWQYVAGPGQGYTCCESAANICTVCLRARIHRWNKGWNGSGSSPSDPLATFFASSYSYILMLCWPRGLSSKKSERRLLTKRCNKDLIELKLRLLPNASESTGKDKESCSTDLGNDPDHQEDIGVVVPQCR